ncbi:hypothetical protein [Nonomuraea sp. NPDC049158]|uniref:hypothetical protein n=1 Tax=Nonomuraea sp. NPDC049158 TaxID=3155649 RepID=UPI0033E413A1
MTTLTWIRPWYPAGPTGHIYRDCPHLLRWICEPVEGAGWLDPRTDATSPLQGARTCPGCLHRFDPELAHELATADEPDGEPNDEEEQS